MAAPEKKTRIPPNSKESEMMVLGCMLTNINALNVGADSLSEPDFYYTEHQVVYSALKAAYRADKPADIHLIGEELKRQGKLDSVGGISYLTSLAQYAGTSAFIEEYVQLVREKSILRQMLQAAQGIEKVALEEPADVLAALDQAQSELFQISQENQRHGGVSIKELISGLKAESKLPYLKELQEKQQKFLEKGPDEPGITGIPTHFIDLDKMLNGFNNSNLMILAARPAMGKCVAGETKILNPKTGALTAIRDLVRCRSGELVTLDKNWKLKIASPSAFVADGIKPTFKITTALGKELEATAVHPLLTIKGWKRLEELKITDRIAIPRKLPFFGKNEWPEYKIKILAYFLADGNLTNPQPRFTNTNPKIIEDFERSALQFGPIRIHKDARIDRAPTYSVALDREALTSSLQLLTKNPITQFFDDLNLMGKNSHNKFIPDPIFELSKQNIALFINRLFSCDGTAYIANCGGRPFNVIAYASVSKILIHQIQHLLLRFGILSKVRKKKTSCNQKFFFSYELEIHGKDDLICFCKEIGIYGKEERIDAVYRQCLEGPTGWTKDSLPIAIWDIIRDKKGKRSWASLFKNKGFDSPSNLHDGKRSIRRDTLTKIAHVLEDNELEDIASSDVYWDRIISIESTGEKEVFDLTVDESHNFVAGDIIVHNTAMAVCLAENICFRNHIPVGIFSLEMSASQILHRIISSQSEVESEKILTGSLSGSEYQRIVAAVNMMQKEMMIIDDQPGLKITDIRARARRMKEAYNVGFIVIDYLQLISGSGNFRSIENRQTEISEISRNLKNLARELNIPILCAAQLSRKVEERQGHRPMLSDLRESGSIENDADVVMMLFRRDYYDKYDKPGMAEVIIAKNRHGPVGDVQMTFRKEIGQFANYSPVPASSANNDAAFAAFSPEDS